MAELKGKQSNIWQKKLIAALMVPEIHTKMQLGAHWHILRL